MRTQQDKTNVVGKNVDGRQHSIADTKQTGLLGDGCIRTGTNVPGTCKERGDMRAQHHGETVTAENALLMIAIIINTCLTTSQSLIFLGRDTVPGTKYMLYLV